MNLGETARNIKEGAKRLQLLYGGTKEEKSARATQVLDAYYQNKLTPSQVINFFRRIVRS